MGTERDELLRQLKTWRETLQRRTKKVGRVKARLLKLKARRARAAARVRLLRKRLRKASTPAHRALREAISEVGTIEHPPNSNCGPKIDSWQRIFGIHAQPWCGAFVGAMLLRVGVKVTPRVVFTPYIAADAKAGTNGFESWTTEHGKAEVGDLVLFDFPDSHPGIQHVAMLRGPVRNGIAPTVEGNTSSGASGSQDNGGGVFLRTRPTAYIVGYARPRWKP